MMDWEIDRWDTVQFVNEQGVNTIPSSDCKEEVRSLPAVSHLPWRLENTS